MFSVILFSVLNASPAVAIAPDGDPLPTPEEYAEYLNCHFFECSEYDNFYKIINKESNWNPTAQNKTSTAFGLGQFLNSTWQTVGYTKTDDPYIQLDATVAYIKQRYGTPTNAWKFHVIHNYY